MANKPHFSVLRNEITGILSSSSLVIDCTFGAGGHTASLLESSPTVNVIGVDRDVSVSKFADNIKQQYAERFEFVSARFSEISSICESRSVDGILFDIGVSSMQLDNAERGFSFLRDGPLTMTMGKNSISAYDIINSYPEDELADIIYKYGEEHSSRKIASAICNARKIKTIESTVELAEIVHSVKPRTGKIHPATLTFQAIRIAVNEELYELETGLKCAVDSIAVGGKVLVITFQGLEDKIVKSIFKSYTHKPHTNKFKNTCDDEKIFKNLTGDPIKPSREEILINPRSRSAKLRGIVRVK